MKKFRFFGRRGLSVILSLALCMGLASPAFAASFKELQGAIDTGVSVYQEGMTVDSAGTCADKYKIEASKDENGSINVKLWQDVEFDKVTDDAGIQIKGNDKNVTLDLNGKTIDFNPGYTLDGDKFKNKETGAEANPKGNELNKGCVIYLGNDASLTINDSSTRFTEDAEGNRQYIAGSGTGKITGGNRNNSGGGLCLNSINTFTMNGGSITGNLSDVDTYSSNERGGGGISFSGKEMTLNGVDISGNYAKRNVGGGIAVSTKGTVTIKGSVISGNHAAGTGLGGGIYVDGNAYPITMDISDSVIKGNTAKQGGGIYAGEKVTLTMRETALNKNESGDATNKNKENGSAIHVEGSDRGTRYSKISLTDVSFNENVSQGDKGNTVYASLADVTINNSVEFSNNKGTSDPKLPNELSNIGIGWYQGRVIVSEGGKLIDKDTNSETIYPDGASVSTDRGKVESTGISVTKTDNEDGTTTIINKGKDENGENKTVENTVEVPKDENGNPTGEVTVDDKGNTNVPEGSKVTDTDGNETTYPDGATIGKDGNVTTDGKEITKDKDTGDVTIKDGENGETKVDGNGGDVTVNPDGSVEVPEGGKVTDKDGSETTYPGGATIDKDGNVTTDGKEITKDKDTGDVTIKDGENGETKVDGNGENVTVNPDGSVEVPEGGKVTDKDGNETTYPDGATIDKDGNVTTDGKEITKDKDTGDVTIKDGENGETKVDGNGGDVTVNPDGSVEVPAGGKVTDKDGNETTYPDGATIDKDGNVTTDGKEISKDKDTGDVTIKDGDDVTKVEGNGEDDVTVNPDGSVVVPAGGKVTDKDGSETTYPGGATIGKDGNVTTDGKEITKDKDTGDVTIKDGDDVTKVEGNGEDDVTVNPDGSVVVPEGGKIDGVTYPDGATIGKDGAIEGEPEQTDPENPGDNNDPSENPDPENPENPENPEQPETPAPGGDDDFGGAADTGTTINEAEVPLAGIVLVKDVLAELYRHAGSPDGEDAEGEYVKAIAWAIANGIVDADYDVESVVTVAVLKEMLTNYAGELKIAIDGEDDDVVMNCGEILSEVFKAQ